MSKGDAPYAPDCRHCGATNDSEAPECWMCHRPDWRPPPAPRTEHRRGLNPLPDGTGCLAVVGTILIALAIAAFQAARAPFEVVGAVAVLGALVLAVVIALFTTCMIAM